MNQIALATEAACFSSKIETCSAAGRLSAQVLRPARRFDAPPLIVLHGISRNVAVLAELFMPYAERSGRTIIVPHFEARTWPHFQRPSKTVRPDQALLALLDGAVAAMPDLAGPVDLFGHSGGAQLAHRVAMLFPHRVARLHVAAAGWYCLPNRSMPYPYGIGPGKTATTAKWARRKTAALTEFLSIPVSVYVGSEDIARDQALRTTPDLDRQQGPNRRARAVTYVQALNHAAESYGLAPKARLTELPGCVHDVVQAITQKKLASLVLDACLLPA